MISLFALTIALVTATSTPTQSILSTFPETYYGYIPCNTTAGSAFFYALMGNANATKRPTQPLVMFLQGGPGASSLFSAFLETGPMKVVKSTNAQGYNVVPRVHAWTEVATMLYVDNPVGTGFSYSKTKEGFATTDQQVADMLLVFLRGFMKAHAEFASVPLWIFCESYGGKMTAFLGATLAAAIAKKDISVNFKGVALGDGWVDPVACMASYGSYLKAFSQVEPGAVDTMNQLAAAAQAAVANGKGTQATNLWGTQQTYISLVNAGVNWYNVDYYYDYTAEDAMNRYVSTNLTAALGSLIPPGVSFNGQANDVFNYMAGTFMLDGIAQVDAILNAGYEVHIYSGQLDLIVDVLCTEAWMSNLTWSGMSGYHNATRYPVRLPSQIEQVAAYLKEYRTLHFWQILHAGHMVPMDNPEAALYMISTIIGAKQYKPNYKEGPPRTIHRRSPSKVALR